MDVTAKGSALAPDHERHLAVDLQRGESVDDVHARLLERARPRDVAALVTTRLDLDEAHALLAVLRRLDQGGNERRVVARSVHRRLQRDHLRVGGRRVDERLEAGSERVIWVMHQDVAGTDCGELVTVVEIGKGRTSDRDPRILLEVRPLERGQLVDVGEVERAFDGVDELVADTEPLLKPLAQRRRHRCGDFDAGDLAEASPAQLELDRLEEIIGLVGDLEVRVAGDPEHRALEHVHPPEERREEMRQHPLQWHEVLALADGEEAGQALRNLHSSKPLLARLGVAHEVGAADREPGDVRERLPWPDGERRQHGVDVPLVSPLELGTLLRREVLDGGDDDSLGGKRRTHPLRPHLRLLGLELEHPCSGLAQGLQRRAPVGRADDDAGGRLPVQPRDPHHEELVEHLRDDRAELHPLEQRQRGIAPECEHACRVVEKRQLAVDQPRTRIDLRLCGIRLGHHLHHHADAVVTPWLRGGEAPCSDG